MLWEAAVRSRPLSRRAVGVAAFAAVFAAGLALRIWVSGAAVGIPDSDEAVVGLMVRHALHGQLTTFYWGQPYGGTQEVILTVPLFAVFGSSYAALRAVPIALTALAALLVWRIGRRTLGEPSAALAGALMWLWFPENLVHLTHQYGFYASTVVYSALLLLLVLRVIEEPTAARVALLGLVLGLGFWQSVQIVPVALPALAWAFWKQPAARRHAWLGAALAVVGALPWLVWNVRHGWASLMTRADAHEYLHSLRLFASPLLPMTLGLRTPLTGELLLPSKVAVTLVYAVLVALCGYGLFRYRRQSLSIAFIVFWLFPFVWAVSRRVTFLSATPRFLIVLTPVIAILVARLGREAPAALTVAAIALAISVVSVARMNADGEAVHPHGIPVVPRDLGRLIGRLDASHLRYVYADYWIAYRLDFDSHERVVASEIDPAHLCLCDGAVRPGKGLVPRYEPYARAVARHRHGVLLFRRSDTRRLEARLSALGYRRTVTGQFALYVPSRSGA